MCLCVFYNVYKNYRLTTVTPKLTDQLRRMLDDCFSQLNNAMQVKIFNKFSVSKWMQISVQCMSFNNNTFAYMCASLGRSVIHLTLMPVVYYIPVVYIVGQEYQ